MACRICDSMLSVANTISSVDNVGASITKSVGGILRPLCAHCVRQWSIEHSQRQSGQALRCRGVGWDQTSSSLFGRQSEEPAKDHHSSADNQNWPFLRVGTTKARQLLT